MDLIQWVRFLLRTNVKSTLLRQHAIANLTGAVFKNEDPSIVFDVWEGRSDTTTKGPEDTLLAAALDMLMLILAAALDMVHS